MTVRWGTRLALALLWWLEFDRVVYEFMWAAVTGYVPQAEQLIYGVLSLGVAAWLTWRLWTEARIGRRGRYIIAVVVVLLLVVFWWVINDAYSGYGVAVYTSEDFVCMDVDGRVAGCSPREGGR